MLDTAVTQRLRLKLEPYKNNKFLFFISEINIRNTLLPFFASLGAKRLFFMKNKEELFYEIGENLNKNLGERYALCILAYHQENIGNPGYIASLLYSINLIQIKPETSVPFFVYANSDESLEIQFGKTDKARALTIRAAAKQGLKGLIIGNLDDAETANSFVDKIIEVLEDDEFGKMTPLERHLRKLINRAYAYLNKMFGSVEEKEENINKAISLFEEVLEQSTNNYEALLGKAMACASSSDPKKIREGTNLFAKLELVGEDVEKAYEGHAGACYKMAELVEEESIRHEWLLKSVNSLNSLVEWQLREYENIRKVQTDYQDPEFMRGLSNKYSTMGAYLSEIKDEQIPTAINYYLKGIEFDPKVESNYEVVSLLEDSAKEHADFMKIVKICSIARASLRGYEIKFLFKEAEAYFNAGKQHDATNLYNSVNKYITKEQIEAWAKDKENGIMPNKKGADRIATFISFLNHRAIYFRKIGNHEKSLKDLNTAISLDIEDKYFDIYFNIAKAIISSLGDINNQSDYTQHDALNYLFSSIKISLKVDLDTYEKLLKSIKDDVVLNPYINEVKHFLNESHHSIPLFFK